MSEKEKTAGKTIFSESFVGAVFEEDDFDGAVFKEDNLYCVAILVLALLGLPIAVVGLILSIIGGKKLKEAGQPEGLGTAGLVVGIIAVVFTTITFFSCGICHICARCQGENIVNQALQELQNQAK